MSRRFSLLIIFTLLLSSCYLGNDNESLYNQVGQDPADVQSSQRPRSNQAVPNYYYRYGPTVPASPEYAQAQQQYQYQYSQQQYAPYPGQPQQQQQQYAPYPAPASRFYSNPYEVPQASPYYANPYDADQYYVPPSHYYNQEQNQQYRANNPAPAKVRGPNP